MLAVRPLARRSSAMSGRACDKSNSSSEDLDSVCHETRNNYVRAHTIYTPGVFLVRDDDNVPRRPETEMIGAKRPQYRSIVMKRKLDTFCKFGGDACERSGGAHRRSRVLHKPLITSCQHLFFFGVTKRNTLLFLLIRPTHPLCKSGRRTVRTHRKINTPIGRDVV